MNHIFPKLAVAGLVAILAWGCSTDIQSDKPRHTDQSTISAEDVRDCVADELGAARASLQITPYRGGWLLELNNGVLGPNVIFAVIVHPQGTNSASVEYYNGGQRPEGNYETYVKPCLGSKQSNP